MRPDLSKQVKIYPVGGLNTETNNELVSLIDATVLLNADFENARTGCVRKRKPTYRISEVLHPTENCYYAHLYHKTDEANERIYYLIYGRYSDFYKVWEDARLYYCESPFTDWGRVDLGMDNNLLWNHTAKSIIYNPTLYKRKKGGDSTISFFYLIWGYNKRYNNPTMYLNLQIEESISPGGRVSVYPLILQNLHASYITYEEYDPGGYGMQTGHYSYYFLFEDIQGNIQGCFLENKTYYLAGEFRPANDNSGIRINISGIRRFHRIGKKIYIFRTNKSEHSRGTPYVTQQNNNYYFIGSIDIMRDRESYTYDDNTHDSTLMLHETMDAYFNGGLHPDAFIWNGIEEGADCGCIHQGRLFVMYKNRLRWSLTNKHRSFIPSSKIDLDTFGYGCQLVSLKNALIIFTDMDIWIWHGNSIYEMNAIKPYRIHNTGLYRHSINVPNDNTAQVWKDMVLFVDSNGYPKVITGDTVRYLSDDGTPKIRIEPNGPGNRPFDATIVSNEYRVTNYGKVYVCSLTKGFQWSTRDISVRRFLYPNMQLTHSEETVYAPIEEIEEQYAGET